MIVDRYYYHQLNKQEQAIYKAFYKGVMSHQEIIPIPVRGEFSQESFERIFMAMTRDNPLIYFLNQSACSTAPVICLDVIAICLQYFFTKEKVKEYNRKIEKVVNELAGQLHLRNVMIMKKNFGCTTGFVGTLNMIMKEPIRIK